MKTVKCKMEIGADRMGVHRQRRSLPDSSSRRRAELPAPRVAPCRP